MKIKVEQRHIDAGEVSQCRRCPVALAIWEATGIEVAVYPMTGIYFSDWVIVETPRDVADFISHFDYHEKCEPFEFDLPWPPKETTE